MPIILLSIAILSVALLVRRNQKINEQNEAERTAYLVRMAQEEFPNTSLLASLDMLYIQTIREMKCKCDSGESIEEIRNDPMLILNERNRIIAEEVENSGYEMRPFVSQ